jgi:hypothetical protein
MAVRGRRECTANYAVLVEVSSQVQCLCGYVMCAWTWQNRNCIPSCKVVWYFVLQFVSRPQTPSPMLRDAKV